MFSETSRYHGLAIAEFVLPDGRRVVYVRRRFLPPASALTTLAEHTVLDKQRLDVVTAKYLKDAEQFWQVADANDAMRPQELTGPDAVDEGRRLRIPLPQGR